MMPAARHATASLALAADARHARRTPSGIPLLARVAGTAAHAALTPRTARDGLAPGLLLAAGCLGLLAVGVTGAATAFVVAGGDGNGTAQVSAPSALSAVSTEVGEEAALFPGGPAVPMLVTVSNPGGIPFTITALTPDLAGLPASCPAAVWEITASGHPEPVEPRGSASVPIEVRLLDDAPSTCQGSSVLVSLHVTGRLG